MEVSIGSEVKCARGALPAGCAEVTETRYFEVGTAKGAVSSQRGVVRSDGAVEEIHRRASEARMHHVFNVRAADGSWQHVCRPGQLTVDCDEECEAGEGAVK